MHSGLKASAEPEGLFSLQLYGIDLETFLQAVGEPWHVVSPLTDYKVKSQPCVVLQGEDQELFPLCMQCHTHSGQFVHVSISFLVNEGQ